MSALVQSSSAPASQMPIVPNVAPGFDFSDMKVFNEIPQWADVVTMRGLVVVYDKCSFGGIKTGKLYVRESQRPSSGFPWEEWLKREWEERDGRCRPNSLLKTERQVVQAQIWPRKDGAGGNDMCWRMDSGWSDGPYYEWAFGLDVIGEVVGLYFPTSKGAS